jgi:hypothetical protein
MQLHSINAYVTTHGQEFLVQHELTLQQMLMLSPHDKQVVWDTIKVDLEFQEPPEVTISQFRDLVREYTVDDYKHHYSVDVELALTSSVVVSVLAYPLNYWIAKLASGLYELHTAYNRSSVISKNLAELELRLYVCAMENDHLIFKA